MSLDNVRLFLADNAPDIEILQLDTSTATVAEAAEAHGVAPGQVAKTLAFRIGERPVLIVAAGDTRLDNRRLRETFQGKAQMLDAEAVLALTGHPVGGVCPFGLTSAVPVYCDASLKAHDEVLPAAGTVNSAVRLAPERLATLVDAEWVDVCQPPASD
ncbi:YbaK/EbsC family protein [Halomonas sp. 18H]|uniref:YbaK/EbsC family protein n=1 Tax=Halomonas almeriensis TaxID=308163 RepID=UPI00223227EC|nr:MULTISPECIES: YbaK/EbsC family protein [Halomonas]MCW4152790.1 YbaK/EbsC family protein [Halomonas sp. 18H]MDN3552010.1 YbaK/EbsC family protein [Halomonas almeriensis]